MQLKDIIEQCSHLKVVEKRCETEEFVDLVFENEEIEEWYRLLSRLLDTPTKPKGQAPSDRDLQVTSKTGGIRTNQTLFEKKFGEVTIVAKFWPWDNNKYTTLRMALLITK